MSQDALDKFGAYRKAVELFDMVVQDMEGLARDPRCWKLISQQVASSDSICANIEEGYGRQTRRDYAHFLVIARGSARETRGRYGRMKHWLSEAIIRQRQALCDEILGILTATVSRLSRPGDRR